MQNDLIKVVKDATEVVKVSRDLDELKVSKTGIVQSSNDGGSDLEYSQDIETELKPGYS